MSDPVLIKHVFTLELTTEENGGSGFVVTCPEIPGVATQGDTEAEAVAMGIDALACALGELIEHPDSAVSKELTKELDRTRVPGLSAEEREAVEDALDQGAADDAVVEMQASGEKPIPWSEVKANLGLGCTDDKPSDRMGGPRK